jgi:glycosyltransferase involved in cell wall biosynthesis
MQDPFSETRSGWKHGIWKVLEEKIFLSASKILVTNEVFKNHYLKRGIRNVIVFPTPIDLDKSRSAITSRTKPFQRYLKIVFTGSVYGPHETPVLAFLEAVKEIKNVRVVFAVPSKKGCLKDHLKDHLKNVNIGFLSKKKCLELQRSADVLFLPLSYEYRYSFLSFPCKVLEYLAAGKPILALVPKKSFMEDLIKNHEVGIVVTEFSAEKIVDAIEELRDEEKRKKFSQNALQTARLFEAKIRSKQLCSLLNDLVSNQKSLRSRDKD